MKKNRKRTTHRQSNENDENLRGRYRQAIKENRRLRRLLKAKSFSVPEVDEWEQYEPEKKIVEVPVNTCPRCGGHDITILDMGIKQYLICNSCPYKGPK